MASKAEVTCANPDCSKTCCTVPTPFNRPHHDGRWRAWFDETKLRLHSGPGTRKVDGVWLCKESCEGCPRFCNTCYSGRFQPTAAAALIAAATGQVDVEELLVTVSALELEVAALKTQNSDLEADRLAGAVATAQQSGAQASTIAEQAVEISSLKKAALAAKEKISSLLEAGATDEDDKVQAEELRRQMHNVIQDLKGNIRTFCRVRQLLPQEARQAAASAPAVTLPVWDVQQRRVETEGRTESFTFDRVFGPAAGQADVFLDVGNLVQSVMDGFNA